MMMKKTETSPAKTRVWTKWLSGAAVGALAMYFSDPDRGRRRRALTRDKMRSTLIRSSNAMDVAARDLSNRMDGVRARAGQMVRTVRRQDADEPVLAARVRSRIGRAVSHPHPINVTVQQGEVTLSGPIFTHEKDTLLKAVRSVPGVQEVHDQLTAHDTAEGVPALQGTSSPRSAVQGNWPPGLRALATAGGSILAMYGFSRRGMRGSLLGAAGVGLLTRSFTNRPLFIAGAQGAADQALHLTKTIHIEASPERVFDLWSDYKYFPYFMSHVQEVKDLGDGRSHWVVHGPAGIPVEWRAILTESRAPEKLAWRTEDDAPMQHSGEVHFEPELTGTRVSLHLAYRPPAGAIGNAAISLFGADPKHRLDEDLMRMKNYIESGIPAHDAAKPFPPLGVQPGVRAS